MQANLCRSSFFELYNVISRNWGKLHFFSSLPVLLLLFIFWEYLQFDLVVYLILLLLPSTSSQLMSISTCRILTLNVIVVLETKCYYFTSCNMIQLLALYVNLRNIKYFRFWEFSHFFSISIIDIVFGFYSRYWADKLEE